MSIPLLRSSPLRDTLKAKIQLVKKVMFDLEKRKGPLLAKPPPPPWNPPEKNDDDIYLRWCAAPDTKWYKRNLFRLVEDLQVQEESERERLRDVKIVVYDNDLSPHRKHLRDKMDAVKRAALDFYPLKAEGETISVLPKDPELMDIDVFLVWCLRWDEYQECRRRDRYSDCKYTGLGSYEQELGCLLETLRIKDDRELQILRLQRGAT